MQRPSRKKVIYQVFTRLFGNTNGANIPWGTKTENGVGKFADFTPKALGGIKELGVTHIWYTGVLHHALVGDYTEYGITNDHPQVVKGRAGSPYAIKDYYNVNPDLALDPSKRLQEFRDLVHRTHRAGLKVIIDIVPNHVARNYVSTNNPKGVVDFGADDNSSKAYERDNNFYYIPNVPFSVPEWKEGYRPLGGRPHPLLETPFEEQPAKWTGNGSRDAQPQMEDWYETVKINYGIRPDGTKDFDVLPEGYADRPTEEHYAFWNQRRVPDSWTKFWDIARFWLDFGIDGFRYDMAEMVPVEFWSYLNANIKHKRPEAILIAEVYDPGQYRNYIHLGKMDYLYDKVDLYDGLKHIMKGYGWSDHIHTVQSGLADIEHHMLRFLENHDEHRIASPEFVGDAQIGKPAMVVSATLGTAPVMLYFAQELGEPAAEHAGYGSPSRTSIFDYIGVPSLQRWVNGKKFDGGQSTPAELELRSFYTKLLNLVLTHKAFLGEYREIHYHNKAHTEGYDHRVFSFVRIMDGAWVLVVVNFDVARNYRFQLKIPADTIASLPLTDGQYTLKEHLQGQEHSLVVASGKGALEIHLNPLESFIFEIKP